MCIASAFRPRGRFEWEVKIHFGEKVVFFKQIVTVGGYAYLLPF